MDRRRQKTSRQRRRIGSIAFGGLLLATAAVAEEERDLGMNIIGNNETPRTLIIVPWKAAEPGDLPLRPLQSLVDTSIGPLDRDVHRRELRWRGAQTPNP